MNRNGSVVVQDARGRDRERYPVVYGARVRVKDGQTVEAGQTILEWDPYTFSILTEEKGTVRYKDIIDAVTVHEDVDEVTGLSQRIIIDSPDEKKQPAIEIRKDNKVVRRYHMPSHAHLMVDDGDEVTAGSVLAKIPRETTKTKDITGGLPRVVELFEARRPRDPAVMSEVDGVVKHGPVVKGQRKIFVVPDDAEQREYSIPRGVHVNVQEGERVRPGEPLMDGPRDPHDILKVLGARELQKYLVNEIQEVYRLQGVAINDKHIEVIVRQMLRWLKVEDVGDTEFLIDEQVDKFRFDEENERVITEGGRPATGRPLLLGITKASLSTDSFISAASFQETTRVLTEASISGKVDYLRGLKENVTMGRLIPAGTGFEYYRHVTIPADEPPPPPPVEQPSDDELELDREMEYFVEPEEAVGLARGRTRRVSGVGPASRPAPATQDPTCSGDRCRVEQGRPPQGPPFSFSAGGTPQRREPTRIGKPAMVPLIVLVVVVLLARLIGYFGVAPLRDWAASAAARPGRDALLHRRGPLQQHACRHDRDGSAGGAEPGVHGHLHRRLRDPRRGGTAGPAYTPNRRRGSDRVPARRPSGEHSRSPGRRHLRGAPATPIVPRVALQGLFIALLWWSGLRARGSRNDAAERPRR